MATIKQQFAKRDFIQKLDTLDLEQLRTLYDKLKTDPEVSFGTLGLISRAYKRKS